MARYGALHALEAIWIGQKGPTSVAFLMAVDPYPFDMAPFGSYLRVSRARLGPAGRTHLRAVYVSEIIRTPDHGEALDEWMFKRAPLFYGAPEDIATSFKHTTDFTKPIRDTVLRLPSERSLPEVAFWRDPRGVFCEHILDLRLLYSKLSLPTAENTNAHTMDLVLYRLLAASVSFSFAEVKSSVKQGPDDAEHHKGWSSARFHRERMFACSPDASRKRLAERVRSV
ncbi:MAG: hypothetical protein ACLPZR_13420 [Solirubrobacteraceae bacterium]